ncbi:MAG: Ig-like domain-containing protein [Bergeyella sp.]
MKNFFVILMVSVLLLSCARVGSPVGGKKDSLAPVMLGSNLDSPRVNVPQNMKELRIDFDEYITLDNINKNLIISPPIKKIKRIFPGQLANKYILIQWEDTLQANATYNFNFGNAIKDNNEGNILPYFNFAFSTGEKIDDLYISGDAHKALTPPKTSTTTTTSSANNDKKIVIGLYKESDSVDYRKKPAYITMADPDGYYELNYLSPGAYRMVAFEDENDNSIFDTGKEPVGFFKDALKLDSSSLSGLNIKLYPTVSKFKYLETKENPGGVLLFFEGKPEKLDIRAVSENLQDYKVTHRPKSDSAYVWFDAVGKNIGTEKSENLKFSYDTGTKQDTISTFYRLNPKNEMALSNNSGNLLPPKKEFEITSNYAIDKIDTEKWTLESDSIQQPFTAKISEKNPFKIYISSDFKEGKKYSLTIPKETVNSFYETIKKSYRFDFEGDKSENYGSLTFKLSNAPAHKFWLQLLESKDIPVYSVYTSDKEIRFESLKPDTYTVRILVDNNENGFWDEADFYNGIFAEDVYFLPKKVAPRPLWDVTEEWDVVPAPPAPAPAPKKAETANPEEQKAP